MGEKKLSIKSFLSHQRNISKSFSKQFSVKICYTWSTTCEYCEISLHSGSVSLFLRLKSGLLNGLDPFTFNRLRTGVEQLHLSVQKWGLSPSPECKCGPTKKTANHGLAVYPMDQVPHQAHSLTVLDDETRCSINTVARPVCSDSEWMPF